MLTYMDQKGGSLIVMPGSHKEDPTKLLSGTVNECFNSGNPPRTFMCRKDFLLIKGLTANLSIAFVPHLIHAGTGSKPLQNKTIQ